MNAGAWLTTTTGRKASFQEAKFFDSLLQLWRPSLTNRGVSGPVRFALAVSGGSDSMALANFCCQVREFREQYPVLRFLRLHAFIVDHKARPDSTEEARRVRRWLHEHFGPNKDDGLKSDILTLEWPSGVIPSKLPNFETEARRLRYQALGKACHEADISSLLLGHHEADRKETLITRLIEGYRGEGLRGIATETDIPECQGIYGAYQSGGRNHMTTRKESAEVLYLKEEQMEGMLPPLKEYRQPGFEYGGVRTYRPLLTFKKQDLKRSLNKAKVPWKEDPTNQDPTVSVRNAIRRLIRDGSLPLALSGASPEKNIYTLENAALDMQIKIERRNKVADILFQALDTLFFDARAGRLEVRIPSAKGLDRRLGASIVDEEHIRARLVRLLFQIVSPQDQISLQSLETATKRMFLDIDEALPGRIDQGRPVFTLTAGGVYCERLDVSNVKLRSNPGKAKKSFVVEHTWRLSRQPYHRNLSEPECTIPSASPVIHNPKAKKEDRIKYPEPPWQLWDGRYWIQVVNSTSAPLFIRPLTEDRLRRLKANIHSADHGNTTTSSHLQKLLKESAPGSLRFTLPAILDANDEVLILPTLNFSIPNLNIEYRIRYRRITLPDNITPEAVIALPEKAEFKTVPLPGVTAHHREIIEERREAKAERKNDAEMKRKRRLEKRERRMETRQRTGRWMGLHGKGLRGKMGRGKAVIVDATDKGGGEREGEGEQRVFRMSRHGNWNRPYGGRRI
ncbi:MAG: hypothetical protein Q9169_006472 [Polycauliona sp. 2 TL-2023]